MKQKKSTPKTLNKIMNANERERSMFDEAVNLGVRDIQYYLPTKQSDEVKVNDAGM